MYAPAKECIYCGAKSQILTREHIVPFALGGQTVIPEASCAIHSEITSRFEGIVARGMYGFERADAGTQSRRRKKVQGLLRQEVEIYGIDKNGREVTVRVAQGDLPRIPARIEMLPPGMLRSIDPDIDEGCTTIADLPPVEVAKKFAEQLGLIQATLHSGWLDPWAFVRQLAKIAHAFTTAEVGVRRFEPLLLPLILGHPFSKTYLVGGFAPQARQASTPLVLTEVAHGHRTLLVVEVSLAAFPRLPKYQAIAGYRQ